MCITSIAMNVNRIFFALYTVFAICAKLCTVTFQKTENENESNKEQTQTKAKTENH